MLFKNILFEMEPDRVVKKTFLKCENTKSLHSFCTGGVRKICEILEIAISKEWMKSVTTL